MLVQAFEPQAIFDDGRSTDSVRPRLFHLAFLPFDYAFLAILSLLLIPAFILARLPFRMDFLSFAGAYWVGTFARSAFLAILLYILGCPLEQTLMPVVRRFQSQKARIAIALLVAAGLCSILGVELGLMVTLDALALGELMERRERGFEPALLDLFLPGLYLFLGVILIFAFNSAIVAVRWAGTYDPVFKHMDWVLFHVNVSSLSHWVLNHSPRWIPSLFEFAYFGLFPEMGAVLILAVLLKKRGLGVQFVRTLLICYTIALVFFLAFPAKGPYFICPDHATRYPQYLLTYSVQQGLGAEVRMLWAHTIPPGASTVTGYFISFPCMHIALAIICIWFLRPWKWICRMVLAWDALVLAPAILLLEWHYMVGMIGGVATAFLAIWISGRVEARAGRRAHELNAAANA